MPHRGKIIWGGCFVMLVTGMLMACTPMGGVTDRTSTPPEAPAWSDMGSNAS